MARSGWEDRLYWVFRHDFDPRQTAGYLPTLTVRLETSACPSALRCRWPLICSNSIHSTCCVLIGPIHGAIAVPSCHALSLLPSLSWTSIRRRRATVATPGEWQCKTALSCEWAQHFSNASCCTSRTKIEPVEFEPYILLKSRFEWAKMGHT